jgi:hypothetical protein
VGLAFSLFVCVNDDAMGRGQNKDSLPEHGRSGVGREYTCPLRIEPELGQISENSSKPSPTSKQACDVLHDDDAGS